MPLYDFERGCKQVEPQKFFKKWVEPDARHIDGRTFAAMKRLVQERIGGLKPSISSQLTWTRCAQLLGYQCDDPRADKLWAEAFTAVCGNPDRCNQFVGSLIMWQIALIDEDIWLTSKDHDFGAKHDHRMYWINNSFIHHEMSKLKNRFQPLH